MPSILNQNQNQTVSSYAKWTNICAILNIVMGVLTLLSIVGGFQIWAGLKLRKAAKTAKAMSENPNLQGYEALVKFSKLLAEQTFYTKIVTIILIVQAAVIIILPILFVGSIVSLFSGLGAGQTSLLYF